MYLSMIRIDQIKVEADHTDREIKKQAAERLKLPESALESTTAVRRSIDARKRGCPVFSYTVDVKLRDSTREAAVIKKVHSITVRAEKQEQYCLPDVGHEPLRLRPVVIGAGPAGLFTALMLAKRGFSPLVLEQGDSVEERARKVHTFWEKGPDSLDLHSNVQFGEGGAGTFSDGKLNSTVKDAFGRGHEVLRIFCEAGADPSILIDSRPHIGTDVLQRVVRNIRERIIELGGEVHFGSCVSDLNVDKNCLKGLLLENGTEVPAEVAVLAIGHSARPLFAVLERCGIQMEPKAFAIGLRIQHPQRQINTVQYGPKASPLFGAAPYKLTAKTSSGRGVYSFCMCPGGYVVDASSEKGGLAVNGMSNSGRGGQNANSAVVVTVSPEDYQGSGPLSGVEFQRRLEQKAYTSGEGKIPVQLYGDFLKNRISRDFGEVEPCFCGKTAFGNLRAVLPQEITCAFLEGMMQFGRKLSGFDRPDAILSGIESRTSSPVRILRDVGFQGSAHGLYPCGEGAGYAGGIMSSAIDGIRVAEAIIKRYRPFYE